MQLSFEYEKVTTAPSASRPGKVSIPPNQIEFQQIFWAHYPGLADININQENVTAPDGVLISFKWQDDPGFPMEPGLSLHFEQEQPTVAFVIGVTLAENAPPTGTVTIDAIPQ